MIFVTGTAAVIVAASIAFMKYCIALFVQSNKAAAIGISNIGHKTTAEEGYYGYNRMKHKSIVSVVLN